MRGLTPIKERAKLPLQRFEIDKSMALRMFGGILKLEILHCDTTMMQHWCNTDFYLRLKNLKETGTTSIHTGRGQAWQNAPSFSPCMILQFGRHNNHWHESDGHGFEGMISSTVLSTIDMHLEAIA